MKTTVRGRVRRALNGLPGGKAVIRSYEKFRFGKYRDADEVFRHHYEANGWACEESVSGDGSTVEYTENLRAKLPGLIEDLDVSTFLDAPCGDLNWVRLVEWDRELQYIGGDIVGPLIERNQAQFGDEHRRFVKLDVTADPLPAADLWMCRDCLFHLSERDVFKALGNFARSDVPYLLTSTHQNCTANEDIPTGSFRELNLELAPYSLGPPVRAIDDWIEGYPVRQLGLWERDTVRAALDGNAAYRRAVGDAA